MRCRNCGFDNSSNASRCEKCNEPIEVVPAKDEASQPPSSNPILSATLKGAAPAIIPGENVTKKAATITDKQYVREFTNCPHCGYPVRKEAPSCPSCHQGLTLDEPEDAREEPREIKLAGGTSNPYSKEKEQIFSLTPIPRVNETPFSKIEFKGGNSELNRDNLEPENNTITGKLQALVEYRNGKWFLIDKSKLKTTYKYVSEPVELKKGDIILLGDRQFKFET